MKSKKKERERWISACSLGLLECSLLESSCHVKKSDVVMWKEREREREIPVFKPPSPTSQTHEWSYLGYPNPRYHLTATMWEILCETSRRTTKLSPSHPQSPKEDCYLKLPCFGVVCYTVRDTWNSKGLWINAKKEEEKKRNKRRKKQNLLLYIWKFTPNKRVDKTC